MSFVSDGWIEESKPASVDRRATNRATGCIVREELSPAGESTLIRSRSADYFILFDFIHYSLFDVREVDGPAGPLPASLVVPADAR